VWNCFNGVSTCDGHFQKETTTNEIEEKTQDFFISKYKIEKLLLNIERFDLENVT